jgi:LysW-gamma-L-lysine carboxypeptidase
VLLGHIDTVPGTVPVRVEDGVLHGRGSVDAKGPLATFACAALEAARRDASVRISVVGAVGEENIGSVGARQVATWPAPHMCIIGEPSGWDAICLGYRGSITATYRVRQESRHTAGPGEASAEKVIAFWNGLVAEADRRNEGSTGFNALTPAVRDMGTSHDGLADEAWLHVGLRLPPGADVRGLVDCMAALAMDGEFEIHGIQEGVRSTKQIPLVPPFLRAIRSCGGTPRFTVKLGTSDMTVVGPVWKCPILAYGPGDASLDHTPEERIVLAEYLNAIKVLTEVLVSL